jgi:hypothetical protein
MKIGRRGARRATADERKERTRECEAQAGSPRDVNIVKPNAVLFAVVSRHLRFLPVKRLPPPGNWRTARHHRSLKSILRESGGQADSAIRHIVCVGTWLQNA